MTKCHRQLLNTQKAWQASRRKYWKQHGNCPGCGGPRKRFVQCVFCRDQRAAAARRLRRERKAEAA